MTWSGCCCGANPAAFHHGAALSGPSPRDPQAREAPPLCPPPACGLRMPDPKGNPVPTLAPLVCLLLFVVGVLVVGGLASAVHRRPVLTQPLTVALAGAAVLVA